MLATHPRLAAAQKSVSAAEEGRRRAFGAFLPTVSLEGDTGPERVRRPGRDERTLSRDTAAAVITQNVYDFGRRSSAYEGAKQEIGVQEAVLDATRQQLILDGSHAYLDVLRSAQLIALATANEATIQRQLNLEDERVQRGAGLAVDVLFAKSRLQLAKERRTAFVGQLREAATRYHQIFGREPSPDAMADPLVPGAIVPAVLDAAIQQALSNNPQIANSARQAEVARARRDAAEADLLPRFDLVGRAASLTDIEGEEGQRREFSLLFRGTWEIFSGFTKQAAVSEATYQYAAARDTIETANRRVVEEVQAAWHDLMVTRERVILLENAVNIAGEVFDARNRLRTAGRETAINVLDAENEFYNARINFVQAAFEARKAAYRLAFAMGMLTPSNLSIIQATPAARTE